MLQGVRRRRERRGCRLRPDFLCVRYVDNSVSCNVVLAYIVVPEDLLEVLALIEDAFAVVLGVGSFGPIPQRIIGGVEAISAA
jgi:hypothetical protein